MTITEVNIKVELPYSLTLLCSSDVHVGHRDVDYKLIERELGLCDRLNINGDIFDAITNSDRKRYRLSVPHDRILMARERQLDEAVDWAYEIYEPYSDRIDVIGVGNHDDSVVKYNHFDIVLELVKRLNAANKEKGIKHRITYGGYTGFIHYNFYVGKSTRIGSFAIQYHHGSGGNSPVTKGMIDLNRCKVWIQNVDLFWKGHKHTKFMDFDEVMHPDGKFQPRVSIFTGSYMDSYVSQSQIEIMKEGRKANFATDNLMAPQGKGGAFITINIDENKNMRYRTSCDSYKMVH